MEGTILLDIKSVKHETSKAWLAILKDDSEVWFPKSQCSMEKDNLISVPEWLMKAKNIPSSWDD